MGRAKIRIMQIPSLHQSSVCNEAGLFVATVCVCAEVFVLLARGWRSCGYACLLFALSYPLENKEHIKSA